MYEAVYLEERNKPTVALVCDGFLNDAKSAASSKGMPGVRIVPDHIISECGVVEDIKAGILTVMKDIVDGLTKPLTEDEKNPKPKEIEKPSRILFKGNLNEINNFFYKRGWSDGLPIIPPTEEAVAEMLTGTDLPPDHIVAELEPRLGKATVEKIAINAVMAGALPTYMPVLITGVQICADPGSLFGGWPVSTGSWAPFWIINGPIRHDLHINNGLGALSPGDIANASIGRAMQLIIKNIGGIRKGIEDMGILGNPGKYSLVLAENEEENPWEPLHVERGFNKEDSTVSFSFPNSYAQVWPLTSDDEGILRAVIYDLIPGRAGGFSLVLTPPLAKILASNGWTKKDIKAFICEYARVQAIRLGTYWGASGRTASSVDTRPGLFKNRVPMKETDEVSLVSEPDSIDIIVAGGPGAFIGLHLGGLYRVYKKIELPANWSNLVNKYKNIVPTYLRY